MTYRYWEDLPVGPPHQALRIRYKASQSSYQLLLLPWDSLEATGDRTRIREHQQITSHDRHRIRSQIGHEALCPYCQISDPHPQTSNMSEALVQQAC